MKKISLSLILILAFALFIRLFWLNLYPNNVTTDELHFILNAKSVFLQFSNLGKNWNPLSFSTIPNETSSEMPFILTSLFIGSLPFGLLFSKIIYVLFGVASIYLIYLICRKLFNHKIALIASLIYTINPWAIYVSRTAFDAPLAMFFFLQTLYLLLIYKNKKILLALIPGALSFYCYIGTKIIFLPAIFIFSYYAYLKNKKDFKYYLSLLLLSLLIVSIYFVRLNSSGGSKRIGELSTPNNSIILSQSLTDKNLSLKTPLKLIYSNKYSVFLGNFFNKYITNFSTDIMFTKGDPTYLVSLWQHGYFYLIDFVLILFGLIGLYKFNKHSFFLILFLIALSPIPEAIRIDRIPAYAFHSCFQYPFLFILIAFGINELLSLKIKLLPLILFSVYLLSYINFNYIYFYRYPIYQSEGFFFSRKIVSQYLKLNSNQPTIVISPEPDSFFRDYLFNTNNLNKSNIGEINKFYQQNDKNNFKIDHVLFTRDMPKKFDKNITYVIDKQSGSQPTNSPYLLINKLSDPAPMFYIINDTLCNKEKLDYFIHDIRIADFNLNKLNNSNFCKKYLNFPL